MHGLTQAQRLQGLIGLALAAGLVVLLEPVLSPLLVAIALAYLTRPLVQRFQSWGLSHTLSACLGFILLLLVAAGLVVLLLPVLAHQLGRALNHFPEVLAWLRQAPFLRLDVPTWSSNQAEYPMALALIGNRPGWLGFFGYLVLVPATTFYILRDWEHLIKRSSSLIPAYWQSRAKHRVEQTQQILSAFFHAQVPVLLILVAWYSLGLYLAGVDLALLIGVVAGLASIVPYLGLVLGLLLASLVLFLQGQGLDSWLVVLVVFSLGQLLATLYLLPRVVADRPVPHPLVVIFALLIGAQLLGWLGALLALPLAALATALWRHPRRQGKSDDPGPTASGQTGTPDEPLIDIDESMRQEDA